MRVTNLDTGLSYNVKKDEWENIQSNPALKKKYVAVPKAEVPEEVLALKNTANTAVENHSSNNNAYKNNRGTGRGSRKNK